MSLRERFSSAAPEPSAPARPALHLETDSVRTPWLDAVDSFTRERAATREAAQQTAPDHRL